MSERQEIARDGAKAQKNSGRGKFQKGDATLGEFLIDYKESGKGVRVDEKMWAKICTDAVKAGNLEPVLKLIIGEGKHKIRLAVISWEEFEELNGQNDSA